MHLEGLKQGSGDGERALGSSKPVRTAGRQILRQGRVFMKIILITVVGKKLFGAVKITPFKNSSKIGGKNRQCLSGTKTLSKYPFGGSTVLSPIWARPI